MGIGNFMLKKITTEKTKNEKLKKSTILSQSSKTSLSFGTDKIKYPRYKRRSI